MSVTSLEATEHSFSTDCTFDTLVTHRVTPSMDGSMISPSFPSIGKGENKNQCLDRCFLFFVYFILNFVFLFVSARQCINFLIFCRSLLSRSHVHTIDIMQILASAIHQVKVRCELNPLGSKAHLVFSCKNLLLFHIHHQAFNAKQSSQLNSRSFLLVQVFLCILSLLKCL